MKSIFKKIALVLALAMVVTMIPAKSASAASDGPQMYKSLLLYLDSGNGNGSDITGNFQSERYASVWNWKECGYDKVVFESADTSVATVNSKGKVTAVKVGKTVVTATFTGDGVSTVTKECKVTVKRNAAKVGLSADSAKKVEAGFSVGEKLQLTAVRKDAEGKTEWNKTMRDYTTDSLRFKSSDENVFKVTKTTGMLTATGAGEATLTVWAVQSEGYDADAKEYPAGVSKEYKVVVNSFSAQATGVKEITVTGAFTDKSEFTVKRNNVSVPLKAEISKDGTTAKLTLDTKLRKGTYTIACGDNSADIVAEDEYVKELVVLEEKEGKLATTDNNRTTVYVHYDVLNQYGESARKTFSVRWNASYGTTVTVDATNGILKITDSPSTGTPTPITYGTSLNIVGVHTQGTNVCSKNAIVKVGLEAAVGSAEVIGIAKKGTEKLLKELPSSFNSYEYVLVYKMLDREGYAMSYDTKKKGDLTFISLSPLLLNFKESAVGQDSIFIEGVEYGVVDLVQGQGMFTREGGTATGMVTSSKTGTKKDFTVSVVHEQVLDSFILVQPSGIIAQNDGDTELKYEAYDTDGKPVTSFRAMNDAVILVGDMKLVEQDDGSAKLYYNPYRANATKNADGVAVLMATVKKTGKNSTLTVYVKDNAVASSVRGIVENGDYVTLVESGSVNVVKKNDWGNVYLQWYDQYDREINPRDGKIDNTFNGTTANYKIGVKYEGKNLKLAGDTTGNVIDPTDSTNNTKEIFFTNKLIITAVGDVTSPSTEIVEFYLVDAAKSNEVVGGSDRKCVFYVADISNVSNYSISENGRKLQNNNDTTGLSVSGTVAGGRKVKVPDTYVSYTWKSDINGSHNLDGTGADRIGTVSGAAVTGAAVTGAAVTLAPNYTNNDPNSEAPDFVNRRYDFYDLTGRTADGKYPARFRDVGISVQIYKDANVIGTAKSVVKIGVEEKYPVSLVATNAWETWKSAYWTEAEKNATVKAGNGIITGAQLKELLKNSGGYKYKNNYDREENIDLTKLSYTITSYVESENGLYSANTEAKTISYWENGGTVSRRLNEVQIEKNSTPDAKITNAEIGDTFVVTFTYPVTLMDGTVKEATMVANVTVGADSQAVITSGNNGSTTWR